MYGNVWQIRKNSIARYAVVTKEVFDNIFDWGIQNFRRICNMIRYL